MNFEQTLASSAVVERSAEPCTLVIFGASGDLTKRKLIPALYALYVENLLPQNLSIVGVARREADFVGDMRSAVQEFGRARFDEAKWETFSKCMSYHAGDFDDAQLYAYLKDHLQGLDQNKSAQGNRLFYLATPPVFFPVILEHLHHQGMISKNQRPFTRVIIEKPFGHDLASANALNQVCLQVLREDQMFRIDHYLGKETVQNILVFRFANGIFEPLWNRRYIDNVQITVAESIGIEGRGGYYDRTGALRDMVQNHLFQLLSLVAMEPPAAFSPDAVRNEKVKVLQSLREMPLDRVQDWVVRGQYAPGAVGGQPALGYQQEKDVTPGSQIETYVALKVLLDNWRWGGVPFYIRSGKRMPKRTSEIVITFRSVPHALFAGVLPENQYANEPNVLSLRIQPDEGITLKVLAKAPGPSLYPQPVSMDFRYGTSFDKQSPEAYERLLLDALLGDNTLFTRGDEVLTSWKFCDRILQAWEKQSQQPIRRPIPQYIAGSWGPVEADALLARDGRAWRQGGDGF